MIKIIILLFMIFLHIYDDFNQGIMSSMKQKTWWEKEAPEQKYKYDYIIVLIFHGFKTTFLAMLPILIYILYTNNTDRFSLYMIYLIIISINHAMTDDYKCNRHVTNLIQDQLIHISLLVWAWYFLIYMY